MDDLHRSGLPRASAPAAKRFRRVLALLDAGVPDGLMAAVMWTRTQLQGGRRVIAIDGKTVRGARACGMSSGSAPHLLAALDHATGTVLEQQAVDAKSDEIPAVRTLLASFDPKRCRTPWSRDRHVLHASPMPSWCSSDDWRWT